MSDPSFISRFYASLEDYLQQLEQAALTGDLAAMRKLGHKMLGLCQLFGTPAQVSLCEALEAAEKWAVIKPVLIILRAQIASDKDSSIGEPAR
ncbi:TPA: Hpt domain-containing protein [Serratia odorifera]|nr:Hpt domain-containing protein [Serratia odorifera]